jgi:hypothetical protein
MRFWIRELAGWLLIGLGLYLFFVCYVILINQGPQPRLLEAGPLTFIGFIVFRGGIHLLKVATAARICLHAQAEMLRQQRPSNDQARDGGKRPGMPLDW